MKKFKILGVALLAVIAVCVFFACGSDGDGGSGDSSLVGTWERVGGSSYKNEIVTIKSNGTGTTLVTYNDSYYDDNELIRFTWKTSGNKLYITYVFDDSYSYEEDETDVFTYTLVDDYLYMEKYRDDSYYSSSKKTYTYKRVK